MLAPIVEARASELLGRFVPGQQAEFMSEFAGAVPVIADILGVPDEDQGEFRRWSVAFASTCDPGIQGEDRDAAIHTACEVVTLGGVDIPVGAMVYLVIAAANRDPRAFGDPGAFDPGRHHCIGAPLARLEGEIIFTRLLKRFPDIGPGPELPVRRVANKVARGWQTRPVRF